MKKIIWFCGEYGKLIYITAYLYSSMIFTYFEDPRRNEDQPQIGFLFSDKTYTYENWVYYFFQHIGTVFLALAMRHRATQFVFTLSLFVCVEIADSVDFVLTRGEFWINPVVTFNTLKVSVYVVSFVMEAIIPYLKNNVRLG